MADGFDRVVSLRGDELADFLELMEGLTTGRERAYQVRMCIDGDQVKMNGHTWSCGYGELDPDCVAAREADTPKGPRGVSCFPPVS